MHNKIKHIAFIMDGNQRWAIKNNRSIVEGYSEGLKKLIESNTKTIQNISGLVLIIISLIILYKTLRLYLF